MDTIEDFCVLIWEEANDLAELKESLSTQDLPSAVNTVRHYLKQQDLVEINIAVTGESGSGKSTFVNAFRGLGDEDEGSAKTGSTETTMEPEVYLHPKYKNVKVWDLPGIGTPNFKADEYLELVQLERYDFFIIIASDRFKECHTQLAKEIMNMKKKFYFVRSRIDFNITAEKRKKHFDEEKTLAAIREDCENGLRKIDIEDPVVFLISGWELSKYDFNLLQETMEKDLPQHKRDLLTLALPNITLEIIERKRKALKKNISSVAIISACMATVPVPGLALVVDLAIIAEEIKKYCSVFGLEEQSLQMLCERSGKSMETLESLLTSVWHKGISKASIISLLGNASLFVTEEFVERILSCIPVIGSLAAGGLSYATIKIMLNRALNDIADDAKRVLTDLINTEVLQVRNT